MVADAIKANPRPASPKGFMSREWLNPSVIALIAANMVPLYGVLFLGWKVSSIILLFWSENMIIGFFTILKMLLAPFPGHRSQYLKLFSISFFILHYGGFTLVHGLLVIGVFDIAVPASADKDIISVLLQAIKKNHLGNAFLALYLSHGFSFIMNYLIKGERRRADLESLMFEPYSRVFVMQVVFVFGGFFITLFKSPTAALALLIFVKIILDIKAHLREHRAVDSQRYPRLPP